jgi:hypothetical protein
MDGNCLFDKSPHGAAAAPADTSAPDGAPSRTAAPSIRDTQPCAGMSEQETTASTCLNLTPQLAKRSSWSTS